MAQIVHSGQQGICNLYSLGLINSECRWLIAEKCTWTSNSFPARLLWTPVSGVAGDGLLLLSGFFSPAFIQRKRLHSCTMAYTSGLHCCTLCWEQRRKTYLNRGLPFKTFIGLHGWLSLNCPIISVIKYSVGKNNLIQEVSVVFTNGFENGSSRVGTTAFQQLKRSMKHTP